MKRILKGYLLTALVCASVTVMVCGVFTADANAKKISLGQTEAAINVMQSGSDTVLSFGETTVTVRADRLFWLKDWAMVMPTPVSNIYWLISGICLLSENGLAE